MARNIKTILSEAECEGVGCKRPLRGFNAIHNRKHVVGRHGHRSLWLGLAVFNFIEQSSSEEDNK
jgi:hypothetical protein